MLHVTIERRSETRICTVFTMGLRKLFWLWLCISVVVNAAKKSKYHVCSAQTVLLLVHEYSVFTSFSLIKVKSNVANAESLDIRNIVSLFLIHVLILPDYLLMKMEINTYGFHAELFFDETVCCENDLINI